MNISFGTPAYGYGPGYYQQQNPYLGLVYLGVFVLILFFIMIMAFFSWLTGGNKAKAVTTATTPTGTSSQTVVSTVAPVSTATSSTATQTVAATETATPTSTTVKS